METLESAKLKLEKVGPITIMAPAKAIIAKKNISFDNVSLREILAKIKIKIGVVQDIAIQFTASTFDKA